MKSLTASTLELQARNLLGDNANYATSVVGEVAGNTWSTSQILDAFNFAIKEYCKKTSATYKVAQCTLQADIITSEVNEVLLPTDNLNVIRVTIPAQGTGMYVIDGNALLLETTKQMESMRNPWWEYQSGTIARKWYKKDARTIGIIPNITLAGWEDTVVMVGYIQAPATLTSVNTVSVANLVVGQWYEISSAGDTDFTTIGAADSVVGTQFQATDVDAGTGTVIEVVDPRIMITHQEYLKYSAAAFLLNMSGDQQSLQMAERFQAVFNSLIGV